MNLIVASARHRAAAERLGGATAEDVPTCQHTTLEWPGTIPEVEEETAAMEKKIAGERGHLDGLLAGAAALLGPETVSV